MFEVNVKGLKDQAAQAAKEREEHKKQYGDSTPICFCPTGRTTLRFYLDPTGRFFRSVKWYKWGNLRLPYMGEDSIVERLITEIEKAGVKKMYEYRANETYIAYAYLFSSDEKSEYVKLQTPLIFGCRWKVYNEAMSRIHEWPEDVLANLFNPEVKANIWTINLTPGKGGNVSVGIDPTQIAIPPLPPTFKPLTEVFYASDAQPKEEDLRKAVEYLHKVLENVKNLKTPEPSSAAPTSAPATPGQTPAPIAPTSKPEAPKAEVPGTCKHVEDGLAWGKPQPIPKCMLCQQQNACREAGKAKA